MGMFDEVTIHYPLPWPEVQDAVWQSKDTPYQNCTRYIVAVNGILLEHHADHSKRTLINGGLVGGSIECHHSAEGVWYSVTFWIRDGVVKDTIFKKRRML